MTHHYHTVLAAIDCSDDSQKILERASALCTGGGGNLHILHVIEPLALAYGADVPMDVTELQASLVSQARESASQYAQAFDVPEKQIHVELGSIEKTIQDKADEVGADLIVIGSHTRSGLALLFGSTARGLVPGAHCDVLAIKVGKRRA